MKHLRFSLFLFLAIIILGSCSKLTRISVQVIEPGAVFLNPNVKTVAIVNRSHPPQVAKKAIIGLFTGEGVLKDQKGSQSTLQGLNDFLKTNRRLSGKLVTEEMIGSEHGGVFPPSMHPDTVAKLCKEYNADALVALEDYSANSAVSTAEKVANIAENGLHGGLAGMIQSGLEAATKQYSATQTATIKLGFRLYNTQGRIIDQYTFTSSKNWTTDPYNNIRLANANVYNSVNAINKTSYNAGITYARRLVPTYTWVYRNFYKRSKNAKMGVGSRMALASDWVGAAKIWEECVNELGRKKAGRAAFNLALSYEIRGDLNQAQQWCEKAYAYYKNKQAKYYAQILRQRVWEMQRVQKQMQTDSTSSH